MEVREVKLRRSSIWHNHVLEVTREGKRNVKSNVTARRAIETAEQKEHRLSMPRTKEKARCATRAAAEVVSRDYCSFVHRPRPAFQHRKVMESWAGPENDLRLLLSSLVQSSGLGMRLTAEALEIR